MGIDTTLRTLLRKGDFAPATNKTSRREIKLSLLETRQSHTNISDTKWKPNLSQSFPIDECFRMFFMKIFIEYK